MSFYMDFLLDLLLLLHKRLRQPPTHRLPSQTLAYLVGIGPHERNAAIGLPVGKISNAHLALGFRAVDQGQALVSNALPSLLISYTV
jgi:hypothetical protein